MPRRTYDPSDKTCAESLREVIGAQDTFLFAGKVLITFQEGDSPPAGRISWEGRGGWYVLSEAPSPLPPSQPISHPYYPYKIRALPGVEYYWQLGRAMIKSSKVSQELATREHVTLDWARKRKPSLVPEVYFHDEQSIYYHLIVSMPTGGDRLCNVWAGFDDQARHRCASGLARICRDLAQWRGTSMTGVDGNELFDYQLGQYVDARKWDVAPEILQRHAKEVGMDCSTLVFYCIGVADPSSVFVDEEGNPIFIVDWEFAGFVPKDWVLSSVFLMNNLHVYSRKGQKQDDYDFAVEFGRQLKAQGFDRHVCEAYWKEKDDGRCRWGCSWGEDGVKDLVRGALERI